MPDTHHFGGRRASAALSPFHASLDTPLLSFGGQVWDIRAACEAVGVTGQPGSAKSSTSGRMLRLAMFSAGMGALCLAAKSDEAAVLIADAKAAGRAADVVTIDASGKERCNLLDFAADELGGREGFEANLVEMMRRMSEATRVASDKPASDGENSYFVDGAMKWISHAFPLLMVAEGGLRLADLDRFITSLPANREELRSAEWQRGYCSQVHQRVAQAAKEPGPAGDYARRVVNEHGIFFLTEVPGLDNRPRSSIASTLTNLIYPFLSGKLAELFCTHTTVTPNDCRDGKIIILDLPPLKYGPTGAVAQSLFKYLFGLAMQTRPTTATTRPVMLYIDECQHFLSSADADLLAVSRAAKICAVFITQDQPTFTAKIGEEAAKSLLGKFGTRIFHANLSHETNLAAAELIGKVQKFHVGVTQGTALNAGGGGHQQDGAGGYQGQEGKSASWGQSSSGYLDYEVPPEHFATKLRTGTKVNNYKADAIVVRGNRNWQHTGKHWVQAEFSQR